MRSLTPITLSVLLAFLSSCSTNSTLVIPNAETNSAPDTGATVAPTEVTAAPATPVAQVAPAATQPHGNPLASRVRDLLQAHRYQGVGLEFETDATLDMIYKVFLDARSWNRHFSTIYTGQFMAYDARYQSLTIGGTKNAEIALAFILKNVPQKAPR